MSPIDSILIGIFFQNPSHDHNQRSCQHYKQSRRHNQRILKSQKEKPAYQQTWSHTHYCQTHHQTNMLCWMTEIIVNPNERNVIQKKLETQETGLVRLVIEHF